jgi:exoribonuclease R
MSKIYRIHIYDRNYNSWEIINSETLLKVENLDINPFRQKLLSNDEFQLDNNTVKIVHSNPTRCNCLPGVLVLQGNKTYGSSSSKNNKLYYKCVPNDVCLPSFLVPYEIKKMGFSKVLKNLYVTILFDKWTDKHPYGKLCNVFGPVDDLPTFYEYQLSCKNLDASIQKFQRDTMRSLENYKDSNIIDAIQNRYPKIEDRTSWHIFSIDPLNSKDFDDALGITNEDNGCKKLSIYIANVPLWLDFLNLWNSFSSRVSTIYLPDKKRPMLPPVLSDLWCSLQESVPRVAFVIDIFIDKNGVVFETNYATCIIKVFKNYCYEEPSLFKNKIYTNILETARMLNVKYPYITSIQDSHDLVSYLMVLMNYYSSRELLKFQTGIFRRAILKREGQESLCIPDSVPQETAKFIQILNGSTCEYTVINGSNLVQNLRHEMLGLDSYLHITSPIRRIVDLLNMIKLQEVLNLVKFKDVNAYNFYDEWIQNIEKINKDMKSIRKTQNECCLLELCINYPETIEKEYDGYVLNLECISETLFKYTVFLPELKLTSQIKCCETIANYECRRFRLFLFNNEEKFKKKIRLQLNK